MVRLGKRAGIWALILALLVSLYLIFISQAAKEEEKKRKISKEFEISQFEKIKKALELKLDKVNSEKYILSSQQKELEEETELLQAKLKKEEEKKELISQMLKARSQELNTVKAELEEKRHKNEELHNNLNKLQRDYDKHQLQLEESQSANERLKKKNTALNLKALPREEKEKEATKEAEEAVYGKVLSVNKKFNFIVVNLGRRDGLKIGDELLVFRDNRNVGETFVEKIYDVISIATFSSPLKENIKTGDRIKLRRME